MAREFSISIGNDTIKTGGLVFVNPPAAPNFAIEFLRFWIGQTSATSAQQRVQLGNKASVFPTVTAATPTKLKVADPNVSIITGGTAGAIGTAGVTCSAEGAGTFTQKWDDAFNVLNGWLHVPTPAETIVYPAGMGNGLLMYLPAIPATTTGWSYGLNYREV